MKWLKHNFLRLVVHLFACSLLYRMINFAVSREFSQDVMETLTRLSGEWALKWLLFSLACTPLYTLLGWRKQLAVRKVTGLYAFFFGAAHLLFYAGQYRFNVGEMWIAIWTEARLAIGLIALVILISMAMTSNRWAMHRLKNNWKRLHRTVYLCGILSVVHTLLYLKAGGEVFVYVFLLSLFLILRIPPVKKKLTLARLSYHVSIDI